MKLDYSEIDNAKCPASFSKYFLNQAVHLAAIATCALTLFAANLLEAAETKRVIDGADVVYYFDATEQLVAAQSLEREPRTIVESTDFSATDGLTLVMKSTCKDLPALSGEQEMIGKATFAVYAVAGPTLMVVLGVEDLSGVSSRKIIPLEPGLGTCCCTLLQCGSKKCCPPGCKTTC